MEKNYRVDYYAKPTDSDTPMLHRLCKKPIERR